MTGAEADQSRPLRILFVFALLAGGGEDTELCLLAQGLDPARFQFDAVACFRKPRWPEPTHNRLRAAGVRVDTTPYGLNFEGTVAYLASIVPGYDVVVSCQNVADIYPALERLHLRPPLVERGDLVSEALAGPKHFTTRYVGSSDTVRDAAASRMSGREHHALVISPMVPPENMIAEWGQLLVDVARERDRPTAAPRLFAAPLLAGFECSSHRRRIDGERRDMIALTRHDSQAAEDYRLMKSLGMSAVRDGLRWHLIEQQEGSFDWSSADTQLSAAVATDTPVIWDLLHYGTPDWLDIWSAGFTERFVAFALAAADRIAEQTGMPLYLCPVNEISFFSWGGGEVGYLNPFAVGRGHELKVQLARAAIAATRAIRACHPTARFISAEPLINIVADAARPHQVALAEGHRQAQFQAFDMLTGRYWPQLGGGDDILDILGVNFYYNNQWILDGETLDWRDQARRPLSSLLAEVYARYGKPVMIAETGIEGDDRAEWIAYVAQETATAIALGVPIEGICLYPVMGHIGWDDERYCPNGPIDLTTEGSRVIHAPSQAALHHAATLIEEVRRGA